MQIRIEASDLPGSSCAPGGGAPDGYHGVYVGVQRRNKRGELLGLVAGDAPSATWDLDCKAVPGQDGADLSGRYIQGPPGGRFIYLSWVTVDEAGSSTLFRRAKLWLDAVPPAVIDMAQRSGLIVGRLGLTDAKGNPRCASVRPPVVQWSAE
ncbi:MAG: DUF5990 family protein [Acidimicrobiales bacterium]|jgi:hypothetical protein